MEDSSSSTQQPPTTPTKRKILQSARQLQSATKKALAHTQLVQRVLAVYEENPKISIRKAGQHLTLSYYATKVLVRKEISFFP